MEKKEPIIFEKTFHLGTAECDVVGKWKLSDLMDSLQNTANEQSHALKIWHSDLTDMNLSWVLYKTELVIEQYPFLGETVYIQTFMKGPKSIFCPRYYYVKNRENQIIARAGSLLVLMDRTTRKAVSPESKGIHIPDADGVEPSLKISMGRKQLSGQKSIEKYTPQYSDIDVNGHVNNARYADWLCNSLGIDTLRENEIIYASFRYISEVRPEDKVDNTLTRNDNLFRFESSAEGNCLFEVCGELRPRIV